MEINLHTKLVFKEKRQLEYTHFMLSAGGDVPLFEEEVELEDRPLFRALEFLMLPQSLSMDIDKLTLELYWFVANHSDVEDILSGLKEVEPKKLSGTIHDDEDGNYKISLKDSEIKITKSRRRKS